MEEEMASFCYKVPDLRHLVLIKSEMFFLNNI
jgi:hypothetical protein